MRRPGFAVLPVLVVLAAVGWAAALVAAPATLPPGTVLGLEGRANHLDFLPRWQALPLAQGAIYAVGDVLCHQMVQRSLVLQGNQLPVDARMTGIFGAAVLGLGLAARPGLAREAWWFGDAFLRAALLPERWRPAGLGARAGLAAALLAVALAPAALDVLAESLSAYESTNALRLATGVLAGLAGGLALGAGLRVFESVGWMVLERGLPRAAG